jgi:hypothetical protein
MNFCGAATTHECEDYRNPRRMSMNTKVRLALLVSMLLIPAGVLAGEIPAGWIKAGSFPAQYDMGVDRTMRRQGRAVAYIKGTAERFDGFGTLMQMASPGEYRGKRVRFSAEVKSEKVDSGWAGLWFRVDGTKSGESLAFDNMQGRPIKGTNDWRHVEIVLDVPDNAAGLAFGLLLNGDGEVWMDDLKLEVVTSDVPETGGSRMGPPRNLNFEK